MNITQKEIENLKAQSFGCDSMKFTRKICKRSGKTKDFLLINNKIIKKISIRTILINILKNEIV